MKKITSKLLFFLIGIFGLMHETKAQSEAIPVPTYQNRSEMSPKMTPEQKMLRQLPQVIIDDKGVDLTLFTAEMIQWIKKNPSLIQLFEIRVINLIENKKFEELANILMEVGHSKEVSTSNYKGGQHE